jgi:hypothetical protein
MTNATKIEQMTSARAEIAIANMDPEGLSYGDQYTSIERAWHEYLFEAIGRKSVSRETHDIAKEIADGILESRKFADIEKSYRETIDFVEKAREIDDGITGPAYSGARINTKEMMRLMNEIPYPGSQNRCAYDEYNEKRAAIEDTWRNGIFAKHAEGASVAVLNLAFQASWDAGKGDYNEIEFWFRDYIDLINAAFEDKD